MGQNENNHDDNNEEVERRGQQSNKKRKRKEVAIFGNYRNYYGYRVGQDLEEDPRLKVLKKEWFEGKDCLDIGCNNGTITITIAKNFGCQSILGVDIDGDRVQDAYWNLRRTVKTNTHKIPPKTSKLEDAGGVNGVRNSVTNLESEETRESLMNCSSLQGKDLLNIVTFRKENFVQNWWPPEDKCYHTILCLSVTKWIHLNWGDDGLITLFAKIWKLLQPGGILILEPQPWQSYYKNRQVSEIGFRMVENITSRLSGSKSGFDRPILAFWK
ncbi:hypothetical protein ACSBR2_005743 [Camellia fascicularis]